MEKLCPFLGKTDPGVDFPRNASCPEKTPKGTWRIDVAGVLEPSTPKLVPLTGLTG